MQPFPRLSEKKAWPSAAVKTLALMALLKSGLK